MRSSSVLMALIVFAGCSAAPSSQAQPAATTTAAATGGSTVHATVNGNPITEDDVRKRAGLEIARLEEQIYQLRKQQVDDLVARRLLEAEAGRRGQSLEAFEQAEITSKAGTVINMSSSGGVAALPFAALYCATKFALEGYTEALRHELRPFNIAAVVVAPEPTAVASACVAAAW